MIVRARFFACLLACGAMAHFGARRPGRGGCARDPALFGQVKVADANLSPVNIEWQRAVDSEDAETVRERFGRRHVDPDGTRVPADDHGALGFIFLGSRCK